MALKLDELAFILNSHPLHLNPESKEIPNAAKVARNFFETFGYHVSLDTVIDKWRLNNLPIKHGGHNKVGDEIVEKAFYDSRGNPAIAASMYGHTRQMYYHRWKRMKLK